MQLISSFIKSKRAQNVDDYETWVEGEIAPTLNSFDVGEGREVVLIFEATRVDDVRMYEDYCPTVATYWGTGGARVPYVIDGENEMVVPIQDGRDMDKKQNGLGVGNQGDPAYTVDSTSQQAVAFHQKQDPISGHISPALGVTSQGMGIVAPTLSASNNPSRSPQSSEVTAQIAAMVEATMTVRRLTPKECERLQGFPDDWTAGQPDSARYRQMGNAVAVPVVNWIIERMVEQA